MFGTNSGFNASIHSNNFNSVGNQSLGEEYGSDGSMDGQQSGSKSDSIDVFVTEFICDQIIQTVDSQNKMIFFCFYCNNYIKSLSRVRSHVINSHHLKEKQSNNYEKGLNKKFLIKSITNSLDYLSPKERKELINRELDRIPNDLKHYYHRKGIRLMDSIGVNAYYCKMCENSISSFGLIENHLKSEIHQNLEKRKALIEYVMASKQPIPIIGLQFITEYKNPTLDEMFYKCNLCQDFQNAYQMFLHINSFEHRSKLLDRFENINISTISEQELIYRFNELHRKHGMGYIVKSKESPDLERMVSLESNQTQSNRTNSSNSIKNLFSVKILNEFEAQKVTEIIESIKDETIEYFSNKNRRNSYN